MTPHPDQSWMWQVARNVTMADWGFLEPEQYLIHDRDGKFCPASQCLIDTAGVKRVALPARSPNLNAFAERGVRSVKDECCSNLILFGEGALRHALTVHEDRIDRVIGHLPDPLMRRIDECLKTALGLL